MHQPRLPEGSGGIRKKLLTGLQTAYAAIKADRDQEEEARILEMSPERILKERQALDRRRNTTYMQPYEASWREFLQSRNWTPDQVAELPDDWLYAEWGRYLLRLHYQID